MIAMRNQRQQILSFRAWYPKKRTVAAALWNVTVLQEQYCVLKESTAHWAFLHCCHSENATEERKITMNPRHLMQEVRATKWLLYTTFGKKETQKEQKTHNIFGKLMGDTRQHSQWGWTYGCMCADLLGNTMRKAWRCCLVWQHLEENIGAHI